MGIRAEHLVLNTTAYVAFIGGNYQTKMTVIKPHFYVLVRGRIQADTK